MNGPFLVRMDDATFAEIPNRTVPRTVRLKDPGFEGKEAASWIFGGYCDKLLHKNETLRQLLDQYYGRVDDEECWNLLTHGQRILYSLGALDGQVRNGGITQFFWNRPDLIVPAGDSLATLGYLELSNVYEDAVESLIDKKEQWIELRRRAGGDLESFWAPFQKTYELLNLDWFDDVYFERHGRKLVDLLVTYVQNNKVEFLEQ